MFVYESLTVNIWKITPVRAGVEGADVSRANKVIEFINTSRF